MKNPEESLIFYCRAATLGATAAVFMAGQLYRHRIPSSSTPTKNIDRACAYYRVAGECGEAHGYAYLASLYADEKSTKNDYTFAALYFKKYFEVSIKSRQDYINTSHYLQDLRDDFQRKQLILACDGLKFMGDEHSLLRPDFLYYIFATYDTDDDTCSPILSYIPIQRSITPKAFLKNSATFLFSLLSISLELKSIFVDYATNNPSVIASLICCEKKPEAVIKSLAYWLGNHMLVILENAGLQSVLGEKRLADAKSFVKKFVSTGIFEKLFGASASGMFATTKIDKHEASSQEEKSNATSRRNNVLNR